MSRKTLSKLHIAKPETEKEIREAVGYAVFSSADLAVVYVSGGYGSGVAHHNRSEEDIYMQMASGGVGVGLGGKTFNAVFVFTDAEAYNNFITEGLDLSGHLDVAAKSGDRGGAIGGAADILPGVQVYQLTDVGLMAQAMIKGTKYWRDEELNREEDEKTSSKETSAPGVAAYP